MFPTLGLKVSGLNPKESYSVILNVTPADNHQYKYLQLGWVAVGGSKKKDIYTEYEHPDSPSCGSYWMDKTVAFKMVKLTNNKTTKSSDQVKKRILFLNCKIMLLFFCFLFLPDSTQFYAQVYSVYENNISKGWLLPEFQFYGNIIYSSNCISK